jgi:hypothetical protein
MSKKRFIYYPADGKVSVKLKIQLDILFFFAHEKVENGNFLLSIKLKNLEKIKLFINIICVYLFEIIFSGKEIRVV